MKDNRKRGFFKRNRRIIIRYLIGVIFLISISSFAFLGSSGYENRDDAKKYVLENHTKQTGAENAVTAIYLNYRLWDTIFEAMLLLISAMAVKSLSWSDDDEE